MCTDSGFQSSSQNITNLATAYFLCRGGNGNSYSGVHSGSDLWFFDALCFVGTMVWFPIGEFIKKFKKSDTTGEKFASVFLLTIISIFYYPLVLPLAAILFTGIEFIERLYIFSSSPFCSLAAIFSFAVSGNCYFTYLIDWTKN